MLINTKSIRLSIDNSLDEEQYVNICHQQKINKRFTTRNLTSSLSIFAPWSDNPSLSSEMLNYLLKENGTCFIHEECFAQLTVQHAPSWNRGILIEFLQFPSFILSYIHGFTHTALHCTNRKLDRTTFTTDTHSDPYSWSQGCRF